MKNTLRKEDFVFNKRLSGNFTLEGRLALWDYFEEYEEDMGQQIEFDPVSICLEYGDYGSFEEVKGDYPDIHDLEDLYDHTTVIEHEEGLIIQIF